MRQRLLAGIASNVLGKFAAVGIWFVLTPFILNRVGPGGYALWVLMGAVSSYGFLLDFGIGGAVVKYVAEHVERGEYRQAQATIASARWVYLGIALVAVALGVALAPFVPEWLGVAAEQHRSAQWVVILTAINVAVTIAFTPPMSVLRGLQRHDLYNGVSVVNSFVEAAAMTTALLTGWGVVGMMAAAIPVSLATGLASARLVKNTAPQLPVGWRGGSPAAMRHLVSFSASLFAIQFAGRLQTKTAEFIIAAFGALSAVTPYAIARRLGGIAELIAVQCFKVVMPLASQLDAAADASRLRTLYIVASRVAIAVAVPIAAVLITLGAPILTFWVGLEYAQYARLVALLSIAGVIGTSQWPAVEILQGIARHKVVALASLGGGAANIGLSITLLPVLGLTGVAVATLVATGAAALFLVTPFANRILGVSTLQALRETWMPPMVPGTAIALMLWALITQFPSPSVAMLAMWIAGAATVYVAGYLAMPACAAERRLVSDMLKKISPPKAIVKEAAIATARTAALRPALRSVASTRGKGLVLCYHRITPEPNACDAVESITPGQFAAHIRALGEIGEIVPLRDLLASRSASRRPLFAITFDDDDASHAQVALPTLQALGVHATFFLSGRSLHGLNAYWWFQLEQSVREIGIEATARQVGQNGRTARELARACRSAGFINEVPTVKAPPLLDAGGIQRLASAGMGIGFHTLRHHNLTLLSDDELARALVEGRDALASIAQQEIDILAYPYGAADARVAAAAQRTGYRAAFATCARPISASSNAYLLGRWQPGAIAPDRLLDEVALKLLMPSCEPHRHLAGILDHRWAVAGR
ncbi:MAG TPA: polysaccharide deacetylase family protein [Vicinamibacterales bacterium]|nr:polysaccharide deacetylase family protein [Vicinamibacterales bacterium]